MKRLPKILKRRPASLDGRFRAEQLDLEFSNGARRTFERLISPGRGAVIIVPILNGDTLVLVREYACGLHRYELSLPKGQIDPGETALEAADRELKEEAGYGSRRLEVLRDLSLSPAYMTHAATVVLARDLYPERLPGDEPEIIETVHWPVERASELLWQEAFSEGRSLAALWLGLERHREEQE